MSFDQILPSLEALGLWSYWIIGLASFLEAFFATGVFVPGTLIVDASGILVHQGLLDFLDLVSFVVIGSALGGEAGFWLGSLARRGTTGRWQPERSPSYQRAVALFDRYGGFAMVMGRFLGPVSGLVPFAAALSGMSRRRFLLWNILSGFPYALAHIGFGFVLGGAATSFAPLMTRLGLFLAAVLAVLIVLIWLVRRILRLWPLLKSILRSIGQAILDNPDVQAWARRHPRALTFLLRRFDRQRFSGLPTTLLAVAVLYLITIWAGSVFDFLMLAPIVEADVRLANLIHAFWSSGLLRIATHVTGLGDWKAVTPLALAALVATLARRRFDLSLGLTSALLGEVVCVAILKWLFHRPRPDLAYFSETSGSFPSGHAAVSVAFYAFLFFILWRLKILRALPAAICAVTLAFLIGLSRIYLIEHYLSDVLNGWIVGAIWLIIGVAVAEWWREFRPRTGGGAVQRADTVATLAVLSLLGLVAVWQVAVHDKARNVVVTLDRDMTIASIEELTGSGRIPTETESIIGSALEPINVIVLARDEAAFTDAMAVAGWIKAQDPGVLSHQRAAFAAWTNKADDTAPVTPYFWRSQPNDLAFQKPTVDATLRKRHHVRFWRTEFVTADGLRLYFGAASFDDGLDWGLLHHIDPNIDAERETLAADLGAGAAEITYHRMSQPRLGQTVAGDPWFTDGNATVIRLR